MRGIAAIAGIGQTDFSKASGRSELQLAAEASLAALADAGLTVDDVDGMVTFTIDPTEDNELMRTLGVPQLSYTTRIPHGGAASAATVFAAASAVATGVAKYVLIYRALNARSGNRFGRARNPDSSPTRGTGWDFANWLSPYGALSPAAILSLQTLPWMRARGLTNREFADYIVGIRDFAATNPAAWFYERPITIEDHQSSRWIIEPVLRLFDCCQETDGGVALIVTSTDRARDLRQPAAVVLGAAQGVGRDPGPPERAYAMAGIGPQDLDAAMIYDAFSPHVYMGLEALGICKSDDLRDFVASGAISRGGSVPVNTNGGLIGEAYLHGMNLITEAVRQIRGAAVNQVQDAEVVSMSSGTNVCILGRDAI
jgi:17-hydroxy-3-oxo-4-pregnene-20-carboxyl-CoA lyase